jgi:hypothetical protein
MLPRISRWSMRNGNVEGGWREQPQISQAKSHGLAGNYESETVPSGCES